MKLASDSKNDVLYAWRMKAIEDIPYSRWNVSGGFQMLEKENLYIKNAVSLEVLKQFMGYRVGRREDKNRNYVQGTMMHFARFKARIW